MYRAGFRKLIQEVYWGLIYMFMNAYEYYALSSTCCKNKNGIVMQGNCLSGNKGIACILVFQKHVFCKTSNRSNVFVSSNPVYNIVTFFIFQVIKGIKCGL